MPAFHEIVLDDGRPPVFCLNEIETRYLYDHDVPKYFDADISLSPGDVILDVGANVGLFALHALKRCGGKARIYSFEPIPATFEALRKNASRFGPETWKALQIGLASQDGTLQFSYFPRLPSWSSAYVDGVGLPALRARLKQCLAGDVAEGRLFRWLRPAPAPIRDLVLGVVCLWLMRVKRFVCVVKPLSHVLREEGIERIDLLKIDVEGGEYDVLLGVLDDDWPKIRQIVVEVEHFAQRSAQIRTLLSAHGFADITTKQFGPADLANDFGLLWARRDAARAEP